MGSIEEERAATEAYTAAYEAYTEALQEQVRVLNERLTVGLGPFASGQDRLHELQDALNAAHDDYERVLSTHPGEPAPSPEEWAADLP
ncbi:hypothetical protein [Isoptericola sp. NPDC056134]|uniref:hypothetical protein n=1 Tax=Isoptericola sp. NPDC056134 TaxID=3345723 RepID=UPI0035EE9658